MIPASARVYIQVKETGEIIQLDDFISVSSSISIRSESSATIDIVNRADKWYNHMSLSDRRQTDVAQYLLAISQANKSKEITRELQALTVEARRAVNSNSIHSILGQIATLNQYLIFDLSHRVWIDYRGRDDLYDLQPSPTSSFASSSDGARWYAGFTGIVGGLEESYSQGRDASINITCDSMRKFFENVLIATSLGTLTPLVLASDLFTQSGALTNSLSEFVDGGAIVALLIQVIQSIFFPQQVAGQPPVISTYPGTSFWNIPGLIGSATPASLPKTILNRTYTGFSHRRLSGGISGLQSDADFLTDSYGMASVQNLPIRKSDVIQVISPGRELPVSNPSLLSYLVSQFAIDKLVNAGVIDGTTTNPYQALIQSSFGWDSSRMSGSSILDAVASIMNYHLFFDACGNLIYQKIRYDDFPNYSAGDYDVDGPSNTGFAFIDGVPDNQLPLIDMLGTGDYDTEAIAGALIDASGYGLKFHGRNYIIGDESVKSWRTTLNDSGIITAGVCTPNYIDLTSSAELNAQDAGIFIDKALQSKFGTRLVNFPAVLSDKPNKQMLEVMAAMRVRQANAKLDSIALVLDDRPDLQCGRTMYFMNRRKSYYIERLQQTVVWGQDDGFTTTVTGRYGHHPMLPIGDPWALMLNKTIWSELNSGVNLNQSIFAAQNFFAPLNSITLPTIPPVSS